MTTHKYTSRDREHLAQVAMYYAFQGITSPVSRTDDGCTVLSFELYGDKADIPTYSEAMEQAQAIRSVEYFS